MFYVYPQGFLDSQTIMSFEVKSSTGSPRQATYISQYSHELVSAYLVESTKGDLLCVRRFFEGETGQ